MGLGFVLSFGYWCTDFLVVQRAMAADSMTAARRTPLIAAVPKMFFPFLVILPGPDRAVVRPTPCTDRAVPRSIAVRRPDPAKVTRARRGRARQRRASRCSTTTCAIPKLLLRYFPTGMLGLGLTALLASFMSGMAGNVTAFNTVWTYDIYQAYIRPRGQRRALLWIGPHGHGLRHRGVGRDGVRGGAVQQHHGRPAAGVRVRQRAAARDVPARHVLEARDRPRRVLGPAWPAPSPRRSTTG